MADAHRPLRTDVIPEIVLDGACFALAFYVGATLIRGPEDMFWGDRYVCLLDPFGHQWPLATPGAGPDAAATEEAVAEFEDTNSQGTDAPCHGVASAANDPLRPFHS